MKAIRALAPTVAQRLRRRLDAPRSAYSDAPFFLIAGPCVIESEIDTLRTAEALAMIGQRLGLPVVFKASFDKANRQSHNSYRGPGLEQGLNILSNVNSHFKGELLITTDIHEASHAQPVSDVADILQIPALLCRQTDLLAAAAQTGKLVNLKRCPSVSPEIMVHAARKVQHFYRDEYSTDSGAVPVVLTDRGTAFGYHDIIVDVRNPRQMSAAEGGIIVQDVTHSVQSSRGGADGISSGGMREHVPAIARAAAAIGVDGIFFETHINPGAALCDRETQWPLDQLEELVSELVDIARASKARSKARFSVTIEEDIDDDVPEMEVLP